MRKRELLEQLADYGPEDIIGIGVHLGRGVFDSQAIGEIKKGAGIALLCTTEHDSYKTVPRER